jgi:hypothetical protein
MQATYSFMYDNKYDSGLTPKDNLILLYRKDASCDWEIIPATITPTNNQNTSGKVSVNAILPGEYTLGTGKDLHIKEWENSIKVYPNPTTNELRIESGELRINDVHIFDINGRKILSHLQIISSSHYKIDISNLSTGTYILEIVSSENKTCKKIIKL